MKPCNKEPLMGVMKYPNTYLKSKGVKEGDKVSYQPFCEYEFTVDGEKLFRLYDHQITMVV
jgi:co-chaperonin GroES (HSP10)